MGRSVVADVIVAFAAGVVLAIFAVVTASAQSNLDAGKSPAQMFASGCSACHHTPQEVAHAGRDFLLEHYTTGPRQADAMAAYLDTVRSAPARPAKPRRSPSAEADVAEVDLDRQHRRRAGGRADGGSAAACPGAPGHRRIIPIGRDEKLADGDSPDEARRNPR